jgi:hypothetical protein
LPCAPAFGGGADARRVAGLALGGWSGRGAALGGSSTCGATGAALVGRSAAGDGAGEAAGWLEAGAGAGRGGGGANSGTGAAERAAERERTYQVTAPTSSASRNQRRRRRGGLSFAMGRG